MTTNYQSFDDDPFLPGAGRMLLRLAHLYAVGEHASLSMPANVSLAQMFRADKLAVLSAKEMTLTANQPLAKYEARRASWSALRSAEDAARDSAEARTLFEADPEADMKVVLRPMEVRTFLVDYQLAAN